MDPILQETFEEDKISGDGVYQWQPRMIRAYVDSWSRSEHEAKYKSPIAAFIHGYSKRIHTAADENRRNEPYIGDGYVSKIRLYYGTNYGKIQNLIESVFDGGNEDLEMPPLEEVAEAIFTSKFRRILKEKFPEYVCEILIARRQQRFQRVNPVSISLQIF